MPYVVEWGEMKAENSLEAGSKQLVSLALRNIGLEDIQSDGAQAITVGYRWYSEEQGAYIQEEYMMPAYLPQTIKSGEATSFEAVFITPDYPGSYKLIWDLQTQDGSWLSEQGAAVLDQRIIIY